MLRLKIKLASPDLQDEFFHIALTFQRKIVGAVYDRPFFWSHRN
jgi:hypothetical protein